MLTERDREREREQKNEREREKVKERGGETAESSTNESRNKKVDK